MKRICILVLTAAIGLSAAKANAIEMFTQFGNGDYNHDETFGTLGTPFMLYADGDTRAACRCAACGRIQKEANCLECLPGR